MENNPEHRHPETADLVEDLPHFRLFTTSPDQLPENMAGHVSLIPKGGRSTTSISFALYKDGSLSADAYEEMLGGPVSVDLGDIETLKKIISRLAPPSITE